MSFLYEMEAVTYELVAAYEAQKENIRDLAYARGLGRETHTLAREKRPDNLTAFLKLKGRWTGMGGALEGLNRKLNTVARKLHQQAVLRIVGEGMPPAQRQAWSQVDGVDPIGFVEDLIPAYEQSAFTIAPIYWGGGTKIKVLESLAYGRTCVATSHACEGFADHLQHKDTIWLAQDDDALVDGCLELLGNPSLRDAMAQRGNRLVREEFSIDRFQQIVKRTVSAILADKGVSMDMSAAT